MAFSYEDVLKVLEENKRMRQLIKEFKDYDKMRKEYYEKVQEDLEKYSEKYLNLKKVLAITENDSTIERKFKNISISYANMLT